jgi:hypothetical protein
MAPLTPAQRKAIPKSKYALPQNKGTKKPAFPIENHAHALAADMLVRSALKNGSITKAQAATVRRKAADVLKRTDKTKTRTTRRARQK